MGQADSVGQSRETLRRAVAVEEGMGSSVRNIHSQAAIVGIGATEYSSRSGRSELALALEAIKSAVLDAGMELDEVDGLVRFGASQTGAAEAWIAANLGLPRVRFCSSVDYGGTASCAIVAHAATAVATGQANAVVCYRALNGRSERRPGTSETYQLLKGADPNFDAHLAPYGLTAPAQVFALIAQRHMHEYGTTAEHLAAVALACRDNASRNPDAQMYGKPLLTLESYLKAPFIVDPLRLYDCCLQTDGAAAVVVTNADYARDLKQRPVYIRGAMQAMTRDVQGPLMSFIAGVPITDSPWRQLASELYKRSNITVSDIDVAQVYDCFTPTVIMQLEDFGFCGKGEGGPFAASGAIARGGTLPINTGGGHLSEGYIHGINHVIEGVRQIRGDSKSQVPDAHICLVTGGTPMSPTSAMVLGRE